MHCQNELEYDHTYLDTIPDDIMLKWFRDSYSSSKHLLTLYSVAIGLNAKNILEIGFGRSSFVLAKAAAENGAQLICCDTRDFSYLLNEKEKSVMRFVHGKSDDVWELYENTGIDFAFLDYFSDENISGDFIKREIKTCLTYLKQNGVIAIHDTIVEKYQLCKVLSKLRSSFWKQEYELLSLPYNYGLGLIRKIAPSKYGILDDNLKKKREQKTP